MDIFNKELFNFWGILEKEKVEYIMIGGLAVVLHGYVRATGDIDIWLNDTKNNRLKFSTVMKAYNYNLSNHEKIEFIPGWSDFYIGKLFKLDVIIAMKGLDHLTFEDCLKAASIAEINGLKIPFLNIDHLIINKKATNRFKDQIDVKSLTAIKKVNKSEEE